jgi:pimeloyl-ACP methyl ester carboxylesterase
MSFLNQLSTSTRRLAIGPILGIAASLTIVFGLSPLALASAKTPSETSPKPTIVLVNGAWANSASWNGVIELLQAEGYTVYAPPNPLRSLQGDSDTIADFLKTISGPIVLVGHSYGGMVITNAANGIANVKALVYVDAFAPAQGESACELTAKFPGSVLTSAPTSQVFRAVSYPGAPKGDAMVYVNPSFFMKGFANDLSAKEGAVAEATQNPVTLSAVEAPSGPPAWAHISSWDVVGTIDKAIPEAAQLFMAKRAHAHITEIHAGHLSMVSQPGAVANVIESAARAIS